jgi:hypothetical protein
VFGLLTASRGGVGSAILDPAGLKDTFTREAAAWVERELVPNVGVHAGFVWRRISQLVQLNNANRPLSAFSVPTTILDPGPDGVLRTADDGASIPGFKRTTPRATSATRCARCRTWRRRTI